MKQFLLGLTIGLAVGAAGGWLGHWLINHHSDRYEVIERLQNDHVPNFREPGVHTAVDYVLMNDGHKIYANCDHTTIGNLDEQSSCGFRPLRTYICRPGEQPGDKALADLVCKDDNGWNVYLYVISKKQ